MKSRDEKITFIKRRMKELGFNQRSLAIAAGCKPDALRNLFRGLSQNLRSDINDRIMSIISNKNVPVLGYVGAGAEVFILDIQQGDVPLEEVERPAGSDLPLDIVAVRVRGDSMEPQLEDGWLIFFRRDCNGVPPDCIGELCVVKTERDGMLVKKVRQGSAPGLFHLISKNPLHDPLVDQKLQWAAKILDIRPR